MTGCNVPGCVGDRASLGMCDFHYRRYRRGAPLVTDDERAAFEAEIAAARVEDEAYYEPLTRTGMWDDRCAQKNNPFGHNPDCPCTRGERYVRVL